MTHLKKLIYKRIMPLTIISFLLVTKWWYVSPLEAPNSIMIGFPLAYSCNDWYTSMSEQYFILEFIVDLIVYFIIWFSLIYLVNRFILKIKINRIITLFLYSIAGSFLMLSILIVSIPDTSFYLKRNFEIQIIETQTKFIWKHITRPENRKENKKKTGLTFLHL